MQIDIDLEGISEDERYHLTNGLEKLKHPSESCKEALLQLRRLSIQSYSKFLEEHPEAILQAFSGGCG